MAKLIFYYGGSKYFFDLPKFQITPTNKDAFEAATERGVFLYGPTGTGKTLILRTVFMDIIKYKKAVMDRGGTDMRYPLWIRLSDYLEFCRKDDGRLKSRAMNATWLFLDDLGTSTATDWAIDQVFQLIDYRWENKMQTYVTSNYSPKELATIYHSRVVSRLVELSSTFKLEGEDWRIKSAIRNKTTT